MIDQHAWERGAESAENSANYKIARLHQRIDAIIAERDALALLILILLGTTKHAKDKQTDRATKRNHS